MDKKTIRITGAQCSFSVGAIQENKEKEFAKIKGGIYEMGYNGNEFSYDIELPEHKTYLEDYNIGIFPVTNKEYLEFMNDGGYETYKHWLSDGW